MISIKYCCNFLRNYFLFAKWKAAWWMHEFPSFSLLTFFFPQLKPYTLHSAILLGLIQFYMFPITNRKWEVYQNVSLCIKYIEPVMIRCASAHTHKLQNFYFFFPSLLSISFQLLTNGIDQKSLPIFRSPSWEPSDILSENNFAKIQVLT